MDLTEKGGYKVKIGDGVMTINAIGKTKRKKEMSEMMSRIPCDITLQANGQELKAHKEILKENIEYFKAMFSDTCNFLEASKSVIDLGPHVDFNSSSKIINLLYKGTMHVTVTEVQTLFQLADLWGISSLVDRCADLMVSQLDASNCLDLLQLARSYNCTKLKKASEHVICHQFQVVVHTQAFQDLPATDLLAVLDLEELRTGPKGEDLVLESVMSWWRQDMANRQKSLLELLHNVRRSSVSSECIEKYLKDSDTKDVVKKWTESTDELDAKERQCQQYFLVLCGYLQSRTGPTCPRTATVEKYDPQTRSFTFVSCLPVHEPPSYGVAFNLFGLVVYVTVYSKQPPDKNNRMHNTIVFCYNTLLDKWTERQDIFSSSALEKLTSCLVNEGSVAYCDYKNKIYVVNVAESHCLKVSCNEGEVSCDHEGILPSLTTELGKTHGALQAVAHKGQLFVMGGFYGALYERQISDVVLALSEDGTHWEAKREMREPRTYFTVVSCGDDIYAIGGYGGRPTAHSTRRRMQKCERYCVKQNGWHLFTTMSRSRTHHASVVIKKKIYTLGGKTYASQKHTEDGFRWEPGGARIVSDYCEVEDALSENVWDGEKWRGAGCLNKSRCNFATVVV